MSLRRCCVLIALVFVVGVRTVEAQCTATVTPTTVSVPLIASAYTLSVISGTSCSWTAVSTVSWITVTSGASGSGIGAVSFSVAASATARTGTLTVAGKTVTVTQGGVGCSYTVTPTALSVPLAASAYTLSVTSGTSCSWTAVSNASWITVTSGASGAGIGAVTFSVAASTIGRTGTLTIAGQTVTVTQGGGGGSPPATPRNLRVVL
jgi:hypothetical protein